MELRGRSQELGGDDAGVLRDLSLDVLRGKEPGAQTLGFRVSGIGSDWGFWGSQGSRLPEAIKNAYEALRDLLRRKA